MGEEILPENSENNHDYGNNAPRRTVKTNEMICQRYYTNRH